MRSVQDGEVAPVRSRVVPRQFQEARRSAFGHMLRRRRLDRWLSREEFGGLVGLDGEYISAVEDHQLMPTVDTLIAMADALDAAPADLLREMDDEAELLLYRQLRERHGARVV